MHRIMLKRRITALLVLIIAAGIAYFVYGSQIKTEGTLSKYPFRLGLDLSGGTHLVYKADTSQLPEGQIKDSMDALRDVIERRVNLFGVSEPVVQVQHG
ncbi:MAG TPA: protein translocase subunit SecD, partial [Candidatus Paceibacterota bacterium]|nr:protein translocase subunit SecD [Candidatus Paceibacterota bacterium]